MGGAAGSGTVGGPGAGGAAAAVDAGGLPGVGGAGTQGGIGGTGVIGGTGATGAIGGAGGTGVPEDGGTVVPEGGSTTQCPPSFTPSIKLAPWQPPPPRNRPVVEVLAQLEAEMTGVWRGIAHTPAGWYPSLYEVEIAFGDGHYSARCTSEGGACCIAFYYGSDLDFPEKQFRLDSTDASERASGEIDILFESDAGEPSAPGWQGILQKVETDASQHRLRFEFERSDGYGPIAYDLQRVQTRESAE
jgi:hypothetical protein